MAPLPGRNFLVTSSALVLLLILTALWLIAATTSAAFAQGMSPIPMVNDSQPPQGAPGGMQTQVQSVSFPGSAPTGNAPGPITVTAAPTRKSSPIWTILMLIVVAGFIVYFYLGQSRLNERLGNLESGAGEPGRGRSSRLEMAAAGPRPFSWEPLRRKLEGGFAFLGNSFSIYKPGVVILASPHPALLPLLPANLLHRVLSREDLTTLLVARNLEEEELGIQLYGLQTGDNFNALPMEKKLETLKGDIPALARLENQIKVVANLPLTIEALFQYGQKLAREESLGAIIILGQDSINEAGKAPTEILAQLRLASQALEVPCFVCINSAPAAAGKAYLEEAAGNECISILEIAPATPGELEGATAGTVNLKVNIIRHPQANAPTTLPLDLATGKMG